MNKKILAFSISALSLFALTGCTNSSESTLTNLENQLNRVESIITHDSDISSVSPQISYSENNAYSSMDSFRVNSYDNMMREKVLKEDVLSINSALKSCLQNDVKINKSTSKIVKTLSANISDNISKYNATKSIVKSNVKTIKKSLRPTTINSLGVESSYISLNGQMNERYVYLCNIYDNLEQAYILISNNSQHAEIANNSSQIEQTESKTTNKNPRFRKNIDSYAPSTNYSDIENKTDKKQNEEEDNKGIKNIDSFNNAIPPSRNNVNNPYGYYGYHNPVGGYGYNNAYGYGYNGYGYPGGYRRFNPIGNTDTFYPYNRNIDTYRNLPNNYPVVASQINDEETKEELSKQNGVINISEQNEQHLIPDLYIEADQTKQEEIENLIPDNIPRLVEELENKDTEF